MATVSYLVDGASITPSPMNSLFSAFSSKMETILGGRSFLLAPFDTGSSSKDNGQTQWNKWPSAVVGKPFLFLEGVSAYARYVPGFKTFTGTVFDPTVSGDVSASLGYTYDETVFETPTITPISYDSQNRICTIADIPAAQYPAWLFKLNSVSLFEHSLKCHTRQLQGPDDTEPKTYWLKEQTAPIPTKYYVRALAEIIIEGPTLVSLPDELDKFQCFRFHNLQPRECLVRLGSTSFTMTPFECCCYRRDSDYLGRGKERPEGEPRFKNVRRSAFRYFFEFEDNDPRDFWFHPRLPDGTNYWRTFTSVSGSQGNNLCNPTVLYDFIALLNELGAWAYFVSDPHAHICDLFNLVEEYREKFGKRGAIETTIQNEWLLGDLLHHRGALTVARKTAGVTTLESGSFVGYQPHSEFISEMTRLQINIGTDANGNLTLEDNSGADQVDIVQHGTNFLKGFAEVGTPWPDEWIVQTGRNIDSAFTIESKVLEDAGAYAQDIGGRNPFTLKTKASYRIAQRIINAAARSASYVDIDGTTQTINGTALETIGETLGTQATMAGIHGVTVGQFLALKHFGDANRGTQSDTHVEFTTPTLTLTPEGLVLTFTEKVSAATIPELTDTYYQNQFGNRLKYDATADKWLLKHCIRFRKHGWGFGQHGRNYAAFYGPIDGRLTVKGYSRDVSGPFGADEKIIKQRARSTGANLLRRIDVSELGINAAGERFVKTAKPSIDPPWTRIDALPEFLQNKTAAKFEAMRTKLIPYSNQSLTDPGTEAMPLSVAHYNAMAQAVNQLTEGRVLDYRAFLFVVGPKVLDPNLLPGYAMNGPSPVDCFTRTDNIGDGLRPYWEHLFTTNSVEIKGTADFPSDFDTFKTFQSEQRTAKVTSVANISGAAYAGNRTIYEGATAPGIAYYWRIYTANVAVAVGDVEWNAPTPYLNPGMCAQFGETAPTFNLNTAYNGVAWVSLLDVESMFVALGMPFVYEDVFLPLKLDTFELPNLFSRNDLSQPAYTYAGEVASKSSNVQVQVGPAPSSGVAADIAALNALTATRSHTFAGVVSKFPGFRLANDDEEAEWKQAVNPTTPPTLYYKDARNEGKYHLRYREHVGAIHSLHNGMQLQPTSLQAVTPWHPANFIHYVPGAPGEAGSSAAYPYGGTSGFVEWRAQAGPRVFADMLADTDENLRRAENYFVAALAERYWLAFRVQNTSGGSLRVFQIAQPMFRNLRDWWLGKESTYLSSLAGVHTAPSVDVFTAEHSETVCGQGITVMKPASDTNQRLLFELGRALVSL